MKPACLVMIMKKLHGFRRVLTYTGVLEATIHLDFNTNFLYITIVAVNFERKLDN